MVFPTVMLPLTAHQVENGATRGTAVEPEKTKWWQHTVNVLNAP